MQAAEKQLVYEFLSNDTFSKVTNLKNQAATYDDKQSVLHSWQITTRPLHVKNILSRVNVVMKGKAFSCTHTLALPKNIGI